jgi:hypothetical protein
MRLTRLNRLGGLVVGYIWLPTRTDGLIWASTRGIRIAGGSANRIESLTQLGVWRGRMGRRRLLVL